jgi:hypothetical protein
MGAPLERAGRLEAVASRGLRSTRRRGREREREREVSKKGRLSGSPDIPER